MPFFKKMFLILIGVFSFTFILASTSYQTNECQTKLQEIDKEIEYLEDLKLGLEGRAVRYENQAQRLQFEKDQLVEAKRFWKMAEQNKKSAEEIRKKIEEKKIERKNIIDKYNCKEVSPTSALDISDLPAIE